MSVEKRIDKNHPDFPEYIEKCKALWAKYEPQFDALEKNGRNCIRTGAGWTVLLRLRQKNGFCKESTTRN